MKKTAFKLISLVLSLTMFICLIPLGAVAADDDTLPPTGLVWDDYGTIQSLLLNCFNRLGDVNDDNKVSIADAKAILKMLSNVNPDGPFVQQTYSEIADVNMDGKVSLADAKQILRVCAGLDAFRAKVDLEVGEEFESYCFYDKGSYLWTCTATPETGLEMVKHVDTLPEGSPEGLTPTQYYTFTAKAPGTYEVSFKFVSVGSHDDVLKEVIYIFNVK